MRAARTLALAGLSAAAAACTCSTAPPPVLLAVDPVEAPDHLDRTLRIVGRDFAPEVRADLDDPARSQVDGAFLAALVSGSTRIPLTGVTLVSGQEIQGVLAAGAPVGTYDLQVVDPRGRVALLPGAFAVFAAECLELDAPCDDGDLCTTGDTCRGWRCQPQGQVVCDPPDACLFGTCDPATGLCAFPPVEDGTPCQVTCPAGDTCQAGVCTPALNCENTAPLARLSVRPGGGPAGAVFTLDASASADVEDPLSALQFRFDAEGDGTWDGPFSPAPSLDHAYALPGVFSAAVEVRDTGYLSFGSLSGYATALVVVAAPGEEVRVTTAADERDPFATPASPGRTGLSLWEAVRWANGQSSPRTITLGAPLTVVGSGALQVTAAGLAIVGEPGITIDFGGLDQPCIRLDGPGQRLVGLTLVGCDAIFIQMTAQSAGSQVAHLAILGAGQTALGIDAKAQAPPGAEPTSLIGPGNDLSGLATGLDVLGTDYQIVGNRLYGNGTGCMTYGEPLRFLRNVLSRQVSAGPLPGVGLRLSSGAGPVEIRHNVFDRSGGSGIQSDNVQSLEIRNNLFTRNEGFGVSARAAPGLLLDHNGFFDNAAGDVSADLATGPTDVLLDPLYVDGPGGDYRLLPASPAVDAGLDTGLDVNGAGEGPWFGAAPDLGAEESPY